VTGLRTKRRLPFWFQKHPNLFIISEIFLPPQYTRMEIGMPSNPTTQAQHKEHSLMSLQSATEFTNVIISNPVLMSEVSSAVDGKNEAEASSAISTLGKSKGYDFTPEEAATMRHAFMKQLSDADLDGVAGGINDGGATQIAVGIVAGQIAGEFIPIGGGIIGAGVGAGVGAALNGASASDSLAAGAVGAAQNLNETKSVVQQIFSGW
jgi:hypothetical protein